MSGVVRRLEFDSLVLGGSYDGHFDSDVVCRVEIAAGHAGHQDRYGKWVSRWRLRCRRVGARGALAAVASSARREARADSRPAERSRRRRQRVERGGGGPPDRGVERPARHDAWEGSAAAPARHAEEEDEQTQKKIKQQNKTTKKNTTKKNTKKNEEKHKMMRIQQKKHK